MTVVIIVTIRVITNNYQVHALNLDTLLNTLHTFPYRQFIDEELKLNEVK